MNPESRKKAGVWLAVVFLLGAAIGVVFGYGFAQHKTLAAGPPVSVPPPEAERRAKRVAEMTKEIGLTPEQAQKLDSIIHQTHDNMKTIHDKADADVDAARQNARAQIREMLTPEQKPKFEAMVQRMDAERKRAAENRR